MLCMWCRGEFDDIDGPVHEYMESTPGCWAAYSKVLAAEYQNYRALGDVHRVTADTYAVQHPGKPSPQALQSVWSHLIVLDFYLVRGYDGDRARQQHRRFLQSHLKLDWLPPPDFSGTLNVSHVLQAADPQDHIRRVREWGTSVYDRWRDRHGAAIARVIAALNAPA